MQIKGVISAVLLSAQWKEACMGFGKTLALKFRLLLYLFLNGKNGVQKFLRNFTVIPVGKYLLICGFVSGVLLLVLLLTGLVAVNDIIQVNKELILACPLCM